LYFFIQPLSHLPESALENLPDISKMSGKGEKTPRKSTKKAPRKTTKKTSKDYSFDPLEEKVRTFLASIDDHNTPLMSFDVVPLLEEVK
jgi:hypothetical protein